MKHRNLDGSDVQLEDTVKNSEKYKQALQKPGYNDDVACDDNPPFSQEQISWFGMSRIVMSITTVTVLFHTWIDEIF